MGTGAAPAVPAATIALASGCSLSASTAAARASSVVRTLRRGATPVTAGAPRVSVPVLSNSTASTSRMRSSANRSFTRIPACAAIAVLKRDHQRDRQTQRVRAADHEHGDGVLDRGAGVADHHPRDERDDGRRRGHIEQQRRGAIREHLRARARRLRVGHHALDAGERGVGAQGVDPYAHRGVGGNRATHDAVTDRLRRPDATRR